MTATNVFKFRWFDSLVVMQIKRLDEVPRCQENAVYISMVTTGGGVTNTYKCNQVTETNETIR